ncbi:MAG: glycosyltransferase [Gammaproteobacteria bacterium]|nr:glycosyltransferase [Gammaproteobacteria bacterium]
MDELNKKLSVIIIARNEARNIAGCIESVFEAAGEIPQKEIVLVDSASTDDTVAIARQYGLKIICLGPDAFLSPAAGRFIGFPRTDGKYVFFVDGDMKLEKNWLLKAISVLEGDDEIAGIAGKCREINLDEHYNPVGEKPDRYGVGERGGEKNYLGGSALYKREVLKRTGGYNPYLTNEEELELGFRIRAAGFRLIRTPEPMTVHYTIYDRNETPSGISMQDIKRELRTGRFVSSGTVLRLLLDNLFFTEYLKFHKRDFLFVTLYGIALLCMILSLLTNNILFFGGWALLMSAHFLLRSLLKKSVKDTLLYYAYYSCAAYGLIRGFFRPLRPPSAYTPVVNIISGANEE